jgi:glycerophosphoryl diester phosphodiesterase
MIIGAQLWCSAEHRSAAKREFGRRRWMMNRSVCASLVFSSLMVTIVNRTLAFDAPAFNIQAHRCAGIALPENTLESAEWAWQHGVTPEVDLRLTEDEEAERREAAI